jgi:hypothetical protein
MQSVRGAAAKMTHRTRNIQIPAGFTLLEAMFACVLVVVPIFGLMSAMNSATVLETVTMETVIARNAVRKKAEELQDLQNDVDFPGIFAAYNGTTFSVAEMTLWAGQPGTGSFKFPSSGAQLREDVTDADLGMPRDLNGSNTVDAADHAADYKLLPCTVRVDWTGPRGAEFIELNLLLTSRRAAQ